MLSSRERLLAEKNNLRRERKYLFYAYPASRLNKMDLFHWECGMPGPNTDLYRDSYYTLALAFTNNYPFDPPVVRFDHPVYHPNVFPEGHVCLDILKCRWKPSMNIMQILTGVQQLLAAPNTSSPANTSCCKVYIKDKGEYMRKVRENIHSFHSKPIWKSKNCENK
jgi:ubiquitin-conjugating enzyme E2 I